MRPDQTDPGERIDPGKTNPRSRMQPPPDADDFGESGVALPDEIGKRHSDEPDDSDSGDWHDIKSRFVDDPAGALSAAEGLVRHAVEDRVHALESEANELCAPERGSGTPSTETMRMRLIRYQEYCARMSGKHSV